MRILVTGTAGKVGSHVALELVKHGHTVKAREQLGFVAERTWRGVLEEAA